MQNTPNLWRSFKVIILIIQNKRCFISTKVKAVKSLTAPWKRFKFIEQTIQSNLSKTSFGFRKLDNLTIQIQFQFNLVCFNTRTHVHIEVIQVNFAMC